MHIRYSVKKTSLSPHRVALGLAFLLLLGRVLSVSAIPVYLNESVGDLNVGIETSLVGLKGMAFIENKGPDVIACQVVFRNGPELPIVRKERVNPGAKKMVSATLKRAIVKLTIDVSCQKE